MFASWTTDRQTVITGLDCQLDIRSSFDINTPKYLIAGHQTEARTGVPSKANIIAMFDQIGVRNYFVEINGTRYPPRDAIDIDYTKNDYFNQYGDLRAFFQDYIGEQILKTFMNCTDMKNF